jgi:hypothetical protein
MQSEGSARVQQDQPCDPIAGQLNPIYTIPLNAEFNI